MSQEIPGTLSISNNVIADLAGYAALECYGVVGMAAPTLSDGIAKILPKQRLRRGIIVDNTDDGVTVDLFIVIEYGTNLSIVSKNLVERVEYVLKDYAKVPVAHVEVHVQGVKVHE